MERLKGGGIAWMGGMMVQFEALLHGAVLKKNIINLGG